MKPIEEFDLADWLNCLENRYEQEIQLGLHRIKTVAEKLHLLRPNATVITVAGTNGKGSTVRALERIYHGANYQVGSYTSPHLIKFNERICLNEIPISDKELIQAFYTIEVARGDIPLTYFEMTTLAALYYFKQHVLDLIILEVGLGGRLDATNVIDTDLAIITTIDLDHQNFLGNTKESIGAEKAGILREQKPFIYADNAPPHTVIAQKDKLECPFFSLGVDYHYHVNTSDFEFFFQDFRFKFPKPQVHPNSVGAAIMAYCCLQNQFPIPLNLIEKNLQNLSLSGRQEITRGSINFLFDVSHNPQAVQYLAKSILEFTPKKKVHVVFSALKDKAINEMIEPLLNLVDYWYLTQLISKRAATREQLINALDNYGIMPKIYEKPDVAFIAACNQASADDLIVVFGSFITVGSIVAFLPEQLRRYDETFDG